MEKLKIAVIAPVWIRVPPVSYGGTELVVNILTEGLVKEGHDVTLFASGDSITKAKLVSVYDHPQTEKIGQLVPDVFHTGAAYSYCREENFDIIHDHTCFSGVVLGSFSKTPVLATLHGEFNELTKPFYHYFRNAVYFNAISEFQRRCFPLLRYVPTVYNTIDLPKYQLEEKKEDFLLALSRVSPQKGTHLAIEVAKRANMRLVLAGKVDVSDKEYFDQKVKPLIDGDQIQFLGEVSEEEKLKLMRKACCFLFPIQWAEPFGLVVLEAMACGTPVLAFQGGAIPEIILDGQSGFIVDSLEEMVEAIPKALKLEPAFCRHYVEQKFPPEKMVADYLQNYHLVLSKEGKVAPPASLG